MKYFMAISLFITMLLPLKAQQLVEKYRSQSDERWFNRSQLAERSQAAMTSDYNQNGVIDFITADPNGSNWLEASEPVSTYIEKHGQNYKNSIFPMSNTRFDLDPGIAKALHGSGTVSGFDDGLDFGLVRIDNEGLAELLLHPREFRTTNDSIRESILLKLDSEQGKAIEINRIPNVIGCFDVDGDGNSDIIRYDPDSRQVIVLGIENSSSPPPKESVKYQQYQASEYDVKLKYESDQGQTFAYFRSAFRSTDDWDLNGDGINEIVLAVLDETDHPGGIRVINGANGTSRFSFQFPQDDPDMRSGFRGFYDVNGKDGKEIYLGERTVLCRGGGIHKLPEHFRIHGFIDIDGDGLKDIIGKDTIADKVQVWGKLTANAVNGTLAQRMGINLSPAFPNPMHGQITIPFEQAKANHVIITIHDHHGRLLETLVDRELPAGTHEIQWTAPGIPAAIYVYRIHINGEMIAKSIIKQ